jgi:hypothetical protein
MKDFDLFFWNELNKVIGQKVIRNNNLIINGYNKLKIEKCVIFSDVRYTFFTSDD